MEESDSSPCQQHILPLNTVMPTTNVRNFSVCVPPLHKNFSQAYSLVEWIELNRILGVEEFTFYNYSTAHNVDQILSFYSKLGWVKVLPWDLPLSQIHYFGQMAAINDCLYRNRNKTKYLAFFDIDEFLIPKQSVDYTWSDMFKRFPDVGAYGFRNVFFRKNAKHFYPENYSVEKAKKFSLVTLTNFVRDTFIYRMGVRSKLIVDPNKIDTIGIHYVWKYKLDKNRHTTHSVDIKDGLLHHYRIWHKKNNESIIDTGLLKYKEELIKRVEEVWLNPYLVSVGPSPDWLKQN